MRLESRDCPQLAVTLGGGHAHALWDTFSAPCPEGHTSSFWMSQLQSLGVATEKGPAATHLHAVLDPWPEPGHMMLNH